MKVLFLDMDGVCNCHADFDPAKRQEIYAINPELMERVKNIVAVTGCEIVLSSSWRLHAEGRAAVQKHVQLLDLTPQRAGMRGTEVHEWLSWHPEVERYAILDDNSDFYRFQHLFKTDFNTGLTEEIMQKVIEHLGISS